MHGRLRLNSHHKPDHVIDRADAVDVATWLKLERWFYAGVGGYRLADKWAKTLNRAVARRDWAYNWRDSAAVDVVEIIQIQRKATARRERRQRRLMLRFNPRGRCPF